MYSRWSKQALGLAKQIVERSGEHLAVLESEAIKNTLTMRTLPSLTSFSSALHTTTSLHAYGSRASLAALPRPHHNASFRSSSLPFSLQGRDFIDRRPSEVFRRPIPRTSPLGSSSSINWHRDFSSSPHFFQDRRVQEDVQAAGTSSIAEGGLVPPAPLPVDIPSAKQKREMKAVNTAVAVNVAILIAKIATWTVTSSGALLAEALHSLADVVNQLLLRAGVQQSRRAPTRQHPYGFHREKYIYALMSAVGVFCLGAGASVIHGIQVLIDPPTLEHMGYSLAVLGGSAAAEMISLRVALSALRIGAKEQNQGIIGYMMHGRDPTTAAVLAEDAGAVAGLGIAAIASYMSWVTGSPVYDAVGSIAVGVLMGGVAVMLIRNNKRFLIGQAMAPEMQKTLVEHLRQDPMVLCVIDPMSEELGDGVYRFKAEIQWSGDRVVHKYLGSLKRDSLYAQIRAAACATPGVKKDTLEDAMDLAMMEFGRGVIRTVGEEIDRLEVELKLLCPGLDYVDLETDRGRTESAAIVAAMCYIKGEGKDAGSGPPEAAAGPNV